MENNNNSWLSFFLTKSFYKNLLFSITTFVIVILAILLLLRFYTRHDDLIELPDFNGMNINQVDSILKENSLRYVIIDSVFNTRLKSNSIVSQDPLAGSFVKENRRIYLTIVAKSKKQVLMPNLVDLSLRRAISKLKSIDLSVGNLSFVPDMAKNIVLKQFIDDKEIEYGTQNESE